MATTQLILEGGFFQDTIGPYVQLFEATHVVANGWDCIIREDGTIFCEVAREYSDGVHSMRYVIRPDGFAKLTLKVPHSKVETLRKGYVVPKGAKLSEGILGLAGGNVDQRYAYYRDESFQRFLDRFGISAVKHEDPNQQFTSGWTNYGGYHAGSILKAFTDGNSHREFEESSLGSSWKLNATVDHATWAIVETHLDCGNTHNHARILYTRKNPLELESSLLSNPEVRLDAVKRHQTSLLKLLDGREVKTLADIKATLQEVLAIAPKMKSLLDEEEAKSFLDSFASTNECKLTVEVWGPMPNNTQADFEFRIIRGGGYIQNLKLASGFLG